MGVFVFTLYSVFDFKVKDWLYLCLVTSDNELVMAFYFIIDVAYLLKTCYVVGSKQLFI